MLNLPVNIFNKYHHGHCERQLYIAYYYRTPTPNNPVRYHTALVALPTSAVESKSDSEPISSEGEGISTLAPPASSSSDHSLALKFHAVNVPVNDHGRGRVLWEYRVEKEDPSIAGTILRTRLACLMLVGTVSSDRKSVV